MAGIFKKASLVFLLAILTGCVAHSRTGQTEGREQAKAGRPAPVKTVSGRPEVLVVSGKKAAVISEISNKMVDKGFTLLEETPNKLVFEKEKFQDAKSKIAIGVLFGGEDSREKVVFNILSKNERSLRIMADVFFVRADEGGDNRVTASRQNYPEWQQFLDELDNKYTESEAASASLPKTETVAKADPVDAKQPVRKKK